MFFCFKESRLKLEVWCARLSDVLSCLSDAKIQFLNNERSCLCLRSSRKSTPKFLRACARGLGKLLQTSSFLGGRPLDYSEKRG